MNTESKNVVLLTGAGFTKNFGGYLAGEMWARIFNHKAVQENEATRRCMLSQLNFEDAYAYVMENCAGQEKRAITEALRSVFCRMHDEIYWPSTQRSESLWNVYEMLINPFAGGQEEFGVFFTLNQDLCIEKAFGEYNNPQFDLDVLGISKDAWFTENVFSLLKEPSIVLPDESHVEGIKSGFTATDRSGKLVYVKLHGSCGWRKKNGSDALVIGNMKAKTIAEEPLLRWYHELFRQTLSKQGQKLAVIGYGFRDPHINKAIALGVRDVGLKIYVVGTIDPQLFRANLMALENDPDFSDQPSIGQVIWEGLAGYYQESILRFYDALDLTPQGEDFLVNLGLLTLNKEI